MYWPSGDHLGTCGAGSSSRPGGVMSRGVSSPPARGITPSPLTLPSEEEPSEEGDQAGPVRGPVVLAQKSHFVVRMPSYGSGDERMLLTSVGVRDPEALPLVPVGDAAIGDPLSLRRPLREPFIVPVQVRHRVLVRAVRIARPDIQVQVYTRADRAPGWTSHRPPASCPATSAGRGRSRPPAASGAGRQGDPAKCRRRPA